MFFEARTNYHRGSREKQIRGRFHWEGGKISHEISLWITLVYRFTGSGSIENRLGFWERDGKNILRVSDESARRVSGVEVPETQGSVPRSGERELSVEGDDDVLDEVRVSSECTSRVSVVGIFARERPEDDRLITRRRQDDVGVIERGCDRRDPVRVALKLATQRKRLRHTDMV